MTGTVIATGVGLTRGSLACAAAVAVDAANSRHAALLIELGNGKPRRPTVIATSAARHLELELTRSIPDAAPAARGRICIVALSADEGGVNRALDICDCARRAGAARTVIHSPPALFSELAGRAALQPATALLRAELPAQRALTALTVRGLTAAGVKARVARQPLSWLDSRRALAGMALPQRPGGRSTKAPHDVGPPRIRGEAGQALPLLLGGIIALFALVLALVSIAGALTGKGRAQRAADLAALSAVRSMRDDLDRLFSPALLADGRMNPQHIAKATYLRRARSAGLSAARANGLDMSQVRIGFPDHAAFAPLRARATVMGELDEEPGARTHEVGATALAEAAPPAVTVETGSGGPAFGSGGGYAGPLVYRQGEGMRPDVAAAYDRMAAAAAADGITVVVVSGFRSDAEQAELFAANPDPQWVAPPGQSLHRCATELDLGPSDAYAWLAANATRFGFIQRYSWEAWHYGFEAGSAPCSAAGEAVSGPGDDGEGGSSLGLPAFVPARFREPLLSSAARWNVSAAVLAAQLLAESNFNPYAVSPAGAQGIAQFIPSTAAAYDLSDPFDPIAAIDAQAHLMSDLMNQFGEVSLALAAYNAGPAPVAACSCVPAYPETTAYVARIMALLDGAGALTAPAFEVQLVD